ncbi:MAG TPA: hypothetical protein ENJ95_21410 [Bacteroidetes bacterium]|nr:hypothetical protein [Bacteroidota bacterium]
MFIKELQKNELLAPYIFSDCCENNICVEFDPSISEEDYIVIKIDDFYNATVKSPDTPKSPDCLIVLRCEDGSFHVFIAELKNVQHMGGLNKKDIREKFHTCLTDFMSGRFRDIFYNEKYRFNLKLFLVAGRVRESYSMNFKLDFLLTMRPLQFANKFYGIEGQTPNPIVRPC